MPRTRLTALRAIAGPAIVCVACCIAALSPGCDARGKPERRIVLEIGDELYSLAALRHEYERSHGPGSFAGAGGPARMQFLESVADRKALARLARERFGSEDAGLARRRSEGRIRLLVRTLEERLASRVDADSAARTAVARAFESEIRPSWFASPSRSIAEAARALAVGGASFEEIAEQVAGGDTTLARGASPGWLNAEDVGPDFALELFLDHPAAGYLSGIRRTQRGYEMFRIEELRPLSEERRIEVLPRLGPYAHAVRIRDRVRGLEDSLKAAAGLGVREENIPALGKGWQAFLDSLRSPGGAAQRDALLLDPPFRFFTPEDRALPLYAVRGTTVTLGEYVRGLADAPLSLWPQDTARDALATWMRARATLDLKLEYARSLGLEEGLGYRTEVAAEEEAGLADRYVREVLAPGITITPAEIEAEYRSHPEMYRTGDKIRLSYAVFPTMEEARRFCEEAKRRDGRWWAGRFAEYMKERPDVRIVANSPTYDLSTSVPAEVAGMVEKGRNREVTDILDPLPAPGGGGCVARVLYRERPGIVPLTRVESGLRSTLLNRRIDGALAEAKREARTRFSVRLHPDRL